MVDIRTQHDWNNPKMMDKKELVALYLGLTDKGKKIVYPHLTKDRQKILNIGIKKFKNEHPEYEKQMNQKANHFQSIPIEDERLRSKQAEEKKLRLKQIEEKKELEELKLIALAPLKQFPIYRKIKNYNELALTYELYFHGYTPELHFADKSDTNEHTKKSSFDKCRDKMISKLDEKIRRDYPSIRHYYNGDDIDKLMKLLSALQEVEYSPQVTVSDITEKHKARFTKYYESLDIEEDRAGILANGMIDVLKHRQENIDSHKKILDNAMATHPKELIKLKEDGMLLRIKVNKILSINLPNDSVGPPPIDGGWL